jgi:hypothetical protein
LPKVEEDVQQTRKKVVEKQPQPEIVAEEVDPE